MIKPDSSATIDYNQLDAFAFGTRLIHKLSLLFDFPHISGKNMKADSKQQKCQFLNTSIQELNKWH
jgi:hypothetical protein